MHFKICEFAFVQRFWSPIENTSVNRKMLQISKFTSFTVFWDVVNRYILLSEFVVFCDPSVLLSNKSLVKI